VLQPFELAKQQVRRRDPVLCFVGRADNKSSQLWDFLQHEQPDPEEWHAIGLRA
jgi:hypothetical protein